MNAEETIRLYNELNWVEHGPGIWKATVGHPNIESTPLSAAGAVPASNALAEMGGRPFPFANAQVAVESTASGWLVRFPLGAKDRVYGFGLQFMKFNQRGRTRYLRVNSDPKQDTGESHAPVPFFVSEGGFGVLVNTARIVTVYCGSTVSTDDVQQARVRDRNTDSAWRATPPGDYAEVVLPREGSELYVFAGATVLETVRRYNLFCGGGALPPKWGLGFWHRVYKMYRDEEVVAEAQEFRERQFPCDVIGLEPGWHSASYPVTYDWSQERFPNPPSFVERLRKDGFRVNLWEHPYVSPQAELYEALRPYSGSYSVWGGLAPDYTVPEARESYKQQHERGHVDIGVSGYKLDECDGSELTGNSWMFPAHAKFPSGLDGEQMRQLYGLLFQKMTTELYEKHNRRTYGLVRASNAGASSLPYVLYSDLYDHRQFIRALCNASFSGLLWTPEIRKAASAEDWVRRMQTVVFSPMAMLNGWGDRTKPWSFPETEPIIRHYIRLRMRLLPYLYSAFARYQKDGTPPFRAMPLAQDGPLRVESQASARAGEAVDTVTAAYGGRGEKMWDDQYMCGDSLLVAPLFAGETARDVYLPPGVWYGFETGERYEGGKVVRVEPGLERIPLFVMDGAIIPLMPALPHAPAPGQAVPLDICHFGSSEGRFSLYDDDGETYDYRDGKSVWLHLEAVRQPDGSFAGRLTQEGDYESPYGPIHWHFGLTSLPADEPEV